MSAFNTFLPKKYKFKVGLKVIIAWRTFCFKVRKNLLQIGEIISKLVNAASKCGKVERNVRSKYGSY